MAAVQTEAITQPTLQYREQIYGKIENNEWVA
jgi:hypothetical protein